MATVENEQVDVFRHNVQLYIPIRRLDRNKPLGVLWDMPFERERSPNFGKWRDGRGEQTLGSPDAN